MNGSAIVSRDALPEGAAMTPRGPCVHTFDFRSVTLIKGPVVQSVLRQGSGCASLSSPGFARGTRWPRQGAGLARAIRAITTSPAARGRRAGALPEGPGGNYTCVIYGERVPEFH